MTPTMIRPKSLTIALITLASAAAQAHTSAAALTVTGHYDNAIGISDAASQGVIDAAWLKTLPALRPG